MVTRKMILNTTMAGVLLLALLMAPVYAEEVATVMNPQTDSFTLKGIVDKATALMAPVMEMNQVTVVAAGNKMVNGDVENIEERFVNLLSNAIVHAPQGTEIKANYDGKNLSLWVENSTVSYSIKREVVDAMGNTFLLETRSGEGTFYAIEL